MIQGLPTDPRVASLGGLSQPASPATRIDWRVAADYEIADDIRLYGQISTGFKGGGVNPRPYLEQQVVPFDQETATSYELGFKTMLLDRRLRFSGAYYHTDYAQLSGHGRPAPTSARRASRSCSATRNVGDAKIDGFEARVRGRAGRRFLDRRLAQLYRLPLRQRAGRQRHRYGRDPGPFVPEWKYAIGAQYEIALGDSIGTLTPRVDWTRQDTMQSNIPQQHSPASNSAKWKRAACSMRA